MQSLVSVIVPVYKVEDCLARCLDSLRRQSLSNLEILLIDDASPDRCGEICDAYAATDIRFHVIHNKSNLGLSVVRNIGIAKATGEYLMFVDSDDWIHEDFCKDACECAEKYHVDLVMFRCQRIKELGFFGKKTNLPVNESVQSGYKTPLEAIGLLHRYPVFQAVWNKLYRKDLFNDISFLPDRLYEGTGTVYKALLQASSVYYLDKVLYYYCYRPGSITTLKTEESLHDWIEMSVQQYRDLKAWGYPADKLDDFLKNRALSYCEKKKADASDKQYVFCSNVLLDSETIPSDFTWKRKVLLVLFKHCRPLFEFLCFLFGKKVC